MADNKRTRVDQLLDIEKAITKVWEDEKAFEVDAGDIETERKDKVMLTFPFPYMNGALHLGHAFSLSKADFAAGYNAMKGKYVLFPLAFHCTGMPISAAALKIERELKSQANPTSDSPKPIEPQTQSASQEPDENDLGIKQGRSKKSKTLQKGGPNMTQMEIMEKSGIPKEDIPKFIDPQFWVEYFSPIGQKDLTTFGSLCDWRRSFVTTESNPYFDSFIRWQFNRLKCMGLIKFGERPCVYAQTDRQPCADHDRAEGEGVIPQEYTIIKLKVPKDKLPECLSSLKDDPEEVFFGAATLRPETMYGQTNCWIGYDVNYGAFRLKKGEGIIICTKRAALNLAFQNKTEEYGVVDCITMFTGKDLIGCECVPCLSPLKTIRMLPFAGVNETKGTGVVTSVPSDAPDDWWGIEELRSKPDLRTKWGVKDEWMNNLDAIRIIDVKGYEGKMIAEVFCRQIQETIEKEGTGNLQALKQDAKKESYRHSFYGGTLIVDGPYQNKSITDAKNLIRDDLIRDNYALLYYEPEKRVMSRSGDECVVAITPQWYLDYGNEDWKTKTKKALDNCNVFFPEVRHIFEYTIDWLKEWGCSRSFGLGSRLPWDNSVLIESLSDSTIYNAYYTIAHLLQGDMFGSKPGLLGIKAEDLTDGVWDAIFGLTPMDDKGDEHNPKIALATPNHTIPASVTTEHIARLQKEFKFWYPTDVRVSGKDLIRNHLTFYLFNHTAIFPEEYWPKGIRPNGFLCLNGEKMSKSTGNFYTLEGAIEQFSTSSVRLALADSGDSWDDANFLTDTADKGILRLTKELAWIETIIKKPTEESTGPLVFDPDNLCVVDASKLGFFEKVFNARMDRAVSDADNAYSKWLFREALTRGFYAICDARDAYREICSQENKAMNEDLLRKFIELSTILIAPICRQYADHVWRHELKKAKSIIRGSWPVMDNSAQKVAQDESLVEQGNYFSNVLRDARLSVTKKAPAKGKAKEPEKKKDVECVVYVRDEYFEWQQIMLTLLQELFPNEKALEVAHSESPCTCEDCIKKMDVEEDSDKPKEKKGAWEPSTNPDCIRQPSPSYIMQAIVKDMKTVHWTRAFSHEVRLLIEKYETRLSSEFGLCEAVNGMTKRLEKRIFDLATASIAGKSGGKMTTLTIPEGSTPAQAKELTKLWNVMAGDSLQFGVFMLDKAIKASTVTVFDTKRVFSESQILTESRTQIAQSMQKSIKTPIGKLEVQVVSVPATLTEDELSAKLDPSNKTKPAESEFPPVALRAVPNKPKFKITETEAQ
ncbi:putative Leucine--tRNA ligase [Blattamonas nauphoetae]|uniref:leucine--tRNA ligase n=1 Tax=Blattamonas nauphoetae TaxID=2049346 RepID=A0ABQ9YHI1_9EUKA|nr:putative Leucine--tRNA ligase [Blattamonas nauphoetae]